MFVVVNAIKPEHLYLIMTFQDTPQDWIKLYNQTKNMSYGGNTAALQLIETMLSLQHGIEIIDAIPVKKHNLEEIVNSDEYCVTFMDPTMDYPFKIKKDAVLKVQEYVKDAENDMQKARKVYGFMKKNKVKYHFLENGTRNAEKTWTEKKGSCFDQTLLYVMLARSVGLEASYYSVSVDHNRKTVNHACAGVKIGWWKTVYVDPAYTAFNIEHHAVKKESDQAVWELYNSINGK